MLESWGEFQHVGVEAGNASVQGANLWNLQPHTRPNKLFPPTKATRSSLFGHV